MASYSSSSPLPSSLSSSYSAVDTHASAINLISWQHMTLSFGSDMLSFAAASGGFVASLYIWREARGPLRAITHSLHEAATDLRYYYDRDHPTNIMKRCVSIAGVAVAGVGYLICDRMLSSGDVCDLVRPMGGCVVGLESDVTFAAFRRATSFVFQKHFFTKTFFKDVGAAAAVTATLFAGVIATKVLFPTERSLLPDDTSDDEDNFGGVVGEGGGDERVRMTDLSSSDDGGDAADLADLDGDDDDDVDAIVVDNVGAHAAVLSSAATAASAVGMRKNIASYSSSAIDREYDFADGRDHRDDDFVDTARSASEEDGEAHHPSSNTAASPNATAAVVPPTTRVNNFANPNNPFSRSMTEMGAGAKCPLKVERDVSREIRRFKARRRRWQILRNLVFAPFVEEVVFRAVMLAILNGSDVPYPAFLKYLLLAGGFSLAHFHHITLHAIRSYQHNFDPLLEESRQTRRAWLYGLKVTTAQLVMTAVFTFLNTFIYTKAANRNILAATLAHSMCNYFGPPSLEYLQFMPVRGTAGNTTGSGVYASSPLSSFSTSMAASNTNANSDLSPTSLQRSKANPNAKSGGGGSIFKRAKRSIKSLLGAVVGFVGRPSMMRHDLKMKVISASYIFGIVGFWGWVFAFSRKSARAVR